MLEFPATDHACRQAGGPLLEWHGCYRSNWRGLIVDEAQRHPAKFARGLIERIYEHGFTRGWWRKGDLVLDPFGGVGCGGVIAAYRGLRWIGVELEPQFIELAGRNFALHRKRWAAAGDPEPKILRGDARRLGRLVERCDAVCTSPPYGQGYRGGGGINVKGHGPDGADKVGERTYQGTGADRDENNIERTSGETYWRACRAVYEQCRGVLRRGKVLCVVRQDRSAAAKHLAPAALGRFPAGAAHAGLVGGRDQSPRFVRGERSGNDHPQRLFPHARRAQGRAEDRLRGSARRAQIMMGSDPSIPDKRMAAGTGAKYLRFDLPYPPSANHYWRHVGARTLISREGRRYRAEVAARVATGHTARTIPLTGRLEMRVQVFPPDRRKRDLGNLDKALSDALEWAGVYEDDGQIDRLEYHRRAVVPGGQVIVELRQKIHTPNDSD